jgi:hypothetical protein
MNARNAAIFAAVAAAALSMAGCGGIGNAQVQLRSAIDAKKPSLDSCYEQALERNENLAGGMTVWVHVAEKDGTVSEVEVAESAADDQELTQCIQSALVGTQISPAPKANLKVEYRIELTPEA